MGVSFLWLLLVIAGGTGAFQAHQPLHIFPRQSVSTSLSLSTSSSTTISPQVREAVDQFCTKVQDSLDKRVFSSLFLKGPNKKNKKKKKRRKEGDEGLKESELLRGCLHQVRGRLIVTSKRNQVYLQVTLKYHGATDIVQNWKTDRVSKELSELLCEGYASEWGSWHNTGTDLGIQTGRLITFLDEQQQQQQQQQQWDVDFRTNKWKGERITVVESSNNNNNKSGNQNDSRTTSMVVEAHDRTKDVPIAKDAPFWKAIGLPKGRRSSKQKQCQKFVEIVSRLVEARLTDRHETIETVDMGCGRGYLTFALHHYLSTTHTDRTVHTRGIDMRPKLIAEMNEIAESLEMKGLLFEQGTIETFLSSVLSSRKDNGDDDKAEKSLKIFIALHACDTATDDALWSAVDASADIVVVAPCCHKQVRSQLVLADPSHVYYDILRHNIYRERIAETVTDAMRALLLELSHYRTQVFEFIGGEHTSKNIMITGVRLERQRSPKDMAELRTRLKDLSSLHGIRKQKLAQWMGESLPEKRISTRGMPPI